MKPAILFVILIVASLVGCAHNPAGFVSAQETERAVLYHETRVLTFVDSRELAILKDGLEKVGAWRVYHVTQPHFPSDSDRIDFFDQKGNLIGRAFFTPNGLFWSFPRAYTATVDPKRQREWVSGLARELRTNRESQ